MSTQDLKLKNAIKALAMEQITWFQYLEIILTLDMDTLQRSLK